MANQDHRSTARRAANDHEMIWRHWQHVQTLLPKHDKIRLASLPAATVLTAHHAADAAALAAHYALPTTASKSASRHLDLGATDTAPS